MAAVEKDYLDFIAKKRFGQGQQTQQGPNPYAAGQKVYGGGRSNPTMGPVDPTGYRERDAQAASQRNAMLRRLRAARQNQYMSSAWLSQQGQ